MENNFKRYYTTIKVDMGRTMDGKWSKKLMQWRPRTDIVEVDLPRSGWII